MLPAPEHVGEMVEPEAPEPLVPEPILSAPETPTQQPAEPLAGPNVMKVVLVGAECAPWSKTGGPCGGPCGGPGLTYF